MDELDVPLTIEMHPPGTDNSVLKLWTISQETIADSVRTYFFLAVGDLFVNKEKVTWETLKKEIHFLKEGGQFSPVDCSPTVKVCHIAATLFLYL